MLWLLFVINVHAQEKRNFPRPWQPVNLEQIQLSGNEHGHVKKGQALIRIKDNQPMKVTEDFFAKFFRLQDETGHKYLQNNDGTCSYKIKSESFNGIEADLALIEPPLRYTPAPANILRSDYDKKLSLMPEISLSFGPVQGYYMKDLFNDGKAIRGTSTQYGLHLATKWDLPVQVGAVIRHEQTSYPLSGNGKIDYAATSFGPQFKTKSFDPFGYALRFQTQLRVSPFARALGQTTNGDVEFKFNSADLLISLEHPIKNKLGEFVLGVYFQSQWLSLRDQPEIVSLNPSTETNEGVGVSLAQAFE